MREVAFPSAAAVALLEKSGKNEARFPSRAKLAEHHVLFTWLLGIKDFLGSANEAWTIRGREVRPGKAGSAPKTANGKTQN